MSATSLLSATALSLKTVQVVFGDSGSPATTAETATPVDPAHWKLVPSLDGLHPAYTPIVVSVEPNDPATIGSVALTADQELTPGIIYKAVAVGVTGITTDNIHNVAAFVAVSLSPPADRDFDLKGFLPTINVREDTTQELERFVNCMQEPLSLLWNDVDRWVDILDCDLAPENFVDLMLAELANPFVFADPLTLSDKRKLCHILVELFKLKGTAKGAQAAILFFVGLKSEFFPFDGLGSTLGDDANPGLSPNSPNGADALGDIAHGDATTATVPGPEAQFILGGGGPFQVVLKLGTVFDISIPGSGAGSIATAKQKDRALKIVQVMKPCGLILVLTKTPTESVSTYVRSGCEPSVRNSIRLVDGTHVDLIMQFIADSDDRAFLEHTVPGVNEFNTATIVHADAFTGTKSNYPASSGSPKYWNGVGLNTTTQTVGLLGNEITNALTKPVLVAAAGTRKISLSWAAVPGATSYRIYKSSSAFSSPTSADNAGFPVEISADLTSYDDRQESGTTMVYMVTPVQVESEGFFSDAQTATAL